MATKSKKTMAKINDLSVKAFSASSAVFVGTESVKLSKKRMSRKEKKALNQVRTASGIGMIVSAAAVMVNGICGPMPMLGDYSDMD